MKKILYSACMMLAVCAAFVSCQKDVVVGLEPATDNPAEVLHGKSFRGQMVRSLDGVSDSLEAVLSIVDCDSIHGHCIDVTVSCSGLGVDGTSVANVASEDGYGYVFYNTSTANGLEATTGFRGRVSGDVATINFIKSVKAGFKKKDYSFSFQGSLVTE